MKFVRLRGQRVQPHRLAGRVMAGQLARRFDRRDVTASACRPERLKSALPSPARAAESASARRAAARQSSIRAQPRRPRHPGSAAPLSPSDAATCAAVVGLTPPLRLADGAASGRPVSSSSARIAGCAGQRSAMVGKPAVTAGAIRRACSQAAAPWSAGRARTPPRAAARARINLGQCSRSRQVAHMHDQRVEIGPALRAVNCRYGRGAIRAGGEAIDRLGRHRDRVGPRASRAAACAKPAASASSTCGGSRLSDMPPRYSRQQ